MRLKYCKVSILSDIEIRSNIYSFHVKFCKQSCTLRTHTHEPINLSTNSTKPQVLKFTKLSEPKYGKEPTVHDPLSLYSVHFQNSYNNSIQNESQMTWILPHHVYCMVHAIGIFCFLHFFTYFYCMQLSRFFSLNVFYQTTAIKLLLIRWFFLGHIFWEKGNI